MADREIRLVGSFRDDITPKLRKLNRSIDQVTKSFTKMQSKLRPIAREMGVLAMASERVAKAMRTQRSAMESSIRTMQQYRREAGALNRANRSVATGLQVQKQSVDSSVRAMNQYRTAVGKVIAAQKRLKPTVLPPATALPRQPRAPYAPPPVRGRGGARGGMDLEAGVFGVTLGNTLSGLMTNAIVRGFQVGVGLMQKPFQFIQRGLAERIGDEMSDVRAAGGLFSISRRMEGGGFVRSFAEAESLTKETNRYLAELAGALPGDTQEYINVSKQIADGIYTVISNDKENALKLGQQLAQQRGADMRGFEAGGAQAMQAAGKEIIGEMTKLTVLAGLGGTQGAFGLPQLTEQMIARDEVSMGMFTRYAAIFRDPMIKGALERNIEEINAAGKNTTARLEAIRKAFGEIVTPELVRRYQRTTSGVLEALKTTFLNPEVGLLGLGRPLNFMSKKFDEFGNVVMENGKAVEEALSIFDFLRDIFANIMIVLQPVIEAATKLFDPFTELGKRLDKIREVTMRFQNSFERYREGLENIAKGLKGEEKNTFQATLTLRAALAAVNNAFANLGVYGEAEFQRIAAIIKDPTKGFGEFAKVIQDMVTKFLNSEGAAKIGEAIGGIVGTVISTVGQIMAQLSGVATGGKLAEGFARGFREAGGVTGFRNVIQSVFQLFGKLLLEVFKAAPLEVSILSSLALFGPAIAGAIGTAIVSAIPKVLAGNVLKNLPIAPGRIKGRPQVLARQATQGVKGAASAATAIPKGATTGLFQKGGLLSFLGGAGGKNFMAGLKAVSPKLMIFGGVLSAIIALFEGKGIVGALAEGLGAAGGSAIGAAIGTVIFPGIGTAIGAALGGWIGTMDAVTIPLQQAFQAIGDTLGPIGQSLADVFGSILHVGFSLISVFNPFIPSLQKATGAMDATTAVIIGFKIVLTPVIAAFQLLEQTLNIILIVFRAFEVGLLEARLALSKLNPFGDQQYQAKLRGEIVAANSRLADALKKPAEALERHKEWYNKPPASQEAATTTTTAGGRRGRPAAAPPEANPAPAIQALNTKQAGANVLLNEVKKQIAASSNNQQAKLREIYSKLSSGVSVKVTNTPTVKFDMGGIGPVGGGIGGFAKTSGYGMRWGRMHTGNDYGMPVGTKLGIGGPGKVLFAGNAGGYGKMMDIGGPGGMVYRFAHLSKFNAPVGATLPPGFPFALSGNTGRSTGPHLHFEARPGGLGPVNPEAFAGIVRAGYAGTPIGGLLSAAQMEASKMPYGAQLAVANTDEIFMRPTQMATLVEGSTRAGVSGAGNFEVGKVEVTINDNTGDIARVSDQAAEMILQSMYRQARAEVITS
jgi:murein DD-endopeptidase MepM/ murein hydrolase activator NlpD/archaellum component FlaC